MMSHRPELSHIKAICFDMDGTLIHTEPIALSAVREVLQEKYHVSLSHAEEASLVGMAWSKAMAKLKEIKQLDFEVAAFTAEVTSRYEAQIQSGAPLLPGATEMVHWLAQRYPLALVSGSTRSQILTSMTFHKLLNQFQFVLGFEDYLESKPSPAGYLMAAKKLGIPAAHCLVLEDSAPGIASAKAAGMFAMAVAAGNYTQQAITQADYQIATLWDLKTLLP